MIVRHFLVGASIAAAFFAGRALAPRGLETITPNWPSAAYADDIVRHMTSEGEFASTDGGNAYLWRWNGERIELVGQCSRVEKAPEGQAAYVWLPGVERRP
jgi:hypothetical protein